jgi:signal transduction histidine kinase/predicted negative regulator of RcsB-dependent stress response
MFTAFGQDNAVIDSLKNVLRTAEEDTTKVNNLLSIYEEYWKISDNDNAMRYAESALLLANTLDYKKGIAKSYARIGFIYALQAKYPEALENFLSALKTFQEIGDKKGMAWCYHSFGSTYREQGNLPEALKNYFTALKTYEEIGDKKGMANSYFDIASVYYYQSNYPKALENNYAALKMYKETGDKYQTSVCYLHIGNINQAQGNYPEALENYLASLKIFEEVVDKHGIALAYSGLGNINYYQGNEEEALENYFAALKIYEELVLKRDIAKEYLCIGEIYADQGKYAEALEKSFAALVIFEEIGEKLDIPYSYKSIGNIYQKQGNDEEALKNYLTALKICEENGDREGMAISHVDIGDIYCQMGNYPDARRFLNNGLALSKEIGIKQGIKGSYYSLSKLDSAEGNFAQALEHYKMYTLYKDSLSNEESKNRLALMRIQFETEKKDREIEFLNKDKTLQEQQLEKQTLIRNGLIAGVVFIVLLGLLIFRSFRLRKKLEKQRAILEERHRISADLHDDVGSGLSKITLLSELLKTQAKTPENRKEAEKISDTALEVSSTISEIIWALNSNNDYLENMVAYIRRYAAEYFENSPVKLHIVTQGEILPTPINGEHRRNIFYTVKEALNNILKHAEATEAELKFVVMNDKLDVIISDNGKGIPDGDLNRFGNGINNMRARMKSISGEFKIENHQGTRIFLKLAI